MMIARGRLRPRVLDLAGQLVGLLEAGVGEDDAGQRERRDQALDAARREAAPPAVKLPAWNLNSSTMMAKTGTATFHHVMALLTLANWRMARKLTAVNTAISTTVTSRPVPVIFPFSALNRPGQ